MKPTGTHLTNVLEVYPTITSAEFYLFGPSCLREDVDFSFFYIIKGKRVIPRAVYFLPQGII